MPRPRDDDELDEEETENPVEAAWEAFAAPFEAMNSKADELAPVVSQAAQAGDTETLRKILADHPPYVVNQWVSGAVEEGDRSLLKALLDAGYSPSAWSDPEDEEGVTLLMEAAGAGYREMVADLLAAGADANECTSEGETALSYAAGNGFVGIVRLLVPVTDGDAMVLAMEAAAEEGYAEIFHLLKSAYGEPEEEWEAEAIAEAEASLPETVARRERRAQKPEPATDPATVELLSAALLGKVPKVKRLLEQGAQVNGVDHSRQTALHSAANFGKPAVARLLLAAGADPNASDLEDRTPLHFAAMGGAIAVAQMLLEAGANLNAPDEEGLTPLAIAVDRGKIDLVALLLQAGAATEGKAATEVTAEAEAAAARDAANWQEMARGIAQLAERMGDTESATRLRALGDALDQPEEWYAKEQQARRAQAVEVRLKRRRRIEWDDAEEIEELTDTLEALGLGLVGDFTLAEPPMCLRAFVQPDTSTYAVIYEHPEAGIWVDFLTVYADGGTVTYSNAPTGEHLPQPPAHPRTFDLEADAETLYARLMNERPDAPRQPITAEGFAPFFERRYAEDMQWYRSQGLA